MSALKFSKRKKGKKKKQNPIWSNYCIKLDKFFPPFAKLKRCSNHSWFYVYWPRMGWWWKWCCLFLPNRAYNTITIRLTSLALKWQIKMNELIFFWLLWNWKLPLWLENSTKCQWQVTSWIVENDKRYTSIFIFDLIWFNSKPLCLSHFLLEIINFPK